MKSLSIVNHSIISVSDFLASLEKEFELSNQAREVIKQISGEYIYPRQIEDLVKNTLGYRMVGVKTEITTNRIIYYFIEEI